MNFQEFYDNVLTMKNKLEEDNLDFSDVKIGYTKSSGKNIIVAMTEDWNIHSYFKW